MSLHGEHMKEPAHRINLKKTVVLIIALLLGLAPCLASAAEVAGRKVLYVDSYHPEYQPSMMIRAGVADVLRPAGVKVKYVFLDAKREKSAGKLRAAALRVKRVIEEWHPDAVIAADDAASKYLIQPYYRDSDLPFVFVGVNWEVRQYGFPYKNVTGQIEVEQVKELLTELRKYARGGRIGLLAGRTLTDRKALEYYENVLGIHFTKVVLVDDFRDWQAAYRALQHQVDLLLFRNHAGISGWDDEKAKELIMAQTVIPTGTMSNYMSPLALISYAKVNYEFGEYGARTALQILAGKSPAEIPLTTNKQVKIYLNMKLARQLGVKFPMALIRNAHLISAAPKKLLYVNSYHQGYAWSDDIEKGLLKALQIKARPDGTYDTSRSEVRLRIFRMDTKHRKSEAEIKAAALAAKTIIEKWQPDLLVVSDDNAAKYLVEPYYKNSTLPVVFCGVNWDASVYGFPTRNITGMVEVAPVEETMEMLRKYARGDRIGYIGANTLSEHKNVDSYARILGVHFTDGRLVDNFAQWKKEYLRLQDSVDMLLFFTAVGIEGWNDEQAEQFILAHTRIPSAGTGDHHIRFALLGQVRIAEEQGWWAGKTALRILNGTSPAEIPVTTNKRSRIYLNMRLAKRLGIKFPMELIDKATFVKEIAR